MAYVGAWVLSIAVALSLSSTAYALNFLTHGWSVVRDIANMFFILILVYIALTVMLRAQTSETMQRLAWVIVIALVINFSFFFTRVIIDAGNLLAVQFYNAIEAPTIAQNATDTGSTIQGVTAERLGPGANTKDLTASIMNGIGVQNILNTKSFERFREANKANNNPLESFFTELIALVFIYIALGAVLFILAAMFFTVGIKFIFRIVVLWLVIIASPLAFIAKTVKQGEKYYTQWQDTLIKHAFYPAVFLFIFYILTMFMGELAPCAPGADGVFTCNSIVSQTFDDTSDIPPGTDFFPYIAALLAGIAIRVGFVVALVYIGLKASDAVGVAGAGFARNLGAKGLRGGFWGAGFVGRVAGGGIVGGGLHLAGNAAARAGNVRLASGLWRSGEFLKNRSFDVRKVPGVRGGFSLAGADVGTPQKGGINASPINPLNIKAAIKKSSEESQKLVEQRLGDVATRQANKVDQKLKPHNLEETDKQIESLFNKKLKTGMLSTNEQATLDRLNKHKGEVERKEGKPWETLKTEYAINTKKMEALKPAQIAKLGEGDILKALNHFSAEQIKGLKDAHQHSLTALRNIEKAWHAEGKTAPRQEALKEVSKLGEIHETLKKMDKDLVKKLVTLDAHVQKPGPGATITIDLTKAERMKKEVETELEVQEKVRDDRTLTGNTGGAARNDAGQKAKKLTVAVSRLDKLIEKLKEVPAGTAGQPAPAAIDIKGV